MILKSRPTRVRTMMAIAHEISKRSTCVRRNVGCVLTDKHGRILSVGHNGVPRGMPHCIDNPCEGADQLSGHHLDKCLAMHAEMNALLFCEDIMKVTTCYTTVSPCIQCIKALLQSSCHMIIFEICYDLLPLNLWTNANNEYRILRKPDEAKIRPERSSEISGDETLDEQRYLDARHGKDFQRKPSTDT